MSCECPITIGVAVNLEYKVRGRKEQSNVKHTFLVPIVKINANFLRGKSYIRDEIVWSRHVFHIRGLLHLPTLRSSPERAFHAWETFGSSDLYSPFFCSPGVRLVLRHEHGRRPWCYARKATYLPSHYVLTLREVEKFVPQYCVTAPPPVVAAIEVKPRT